MRGVDTFLKDISPKVNVMAWVEFELISKYTTLSTSPRGFTNFDFYQEKKKRS